MDLLSYFRVLRRRWWLIVVCIVVGAGLGWATTVVSGGTDARSTAKTSHKYYKATHIFLPTAKSDSAFPTSFTNLDQMALLATTGPVPDAVAKALGGSDTGQQLAEQITTLTNSTTGTVAITAIDPDPERAAQLAEAFADQLVASLSAQDLARYQQATNDAQTQLNTLQGKIDALNAQLAAEPPPPNADSLRTQLSALQGQYDNASSNYQEVTSKSAPGSPLTTLQKATAVPISANEYATRLREGQLGQNNLQSGTPSTVQAKASSGGSLDSTSSRMALGAFLGLLTGLGLAVLLERLDRRIRTHADAEAGFGIPVLADVPTSTSREQRDHAVITVTKPLSPAAEAYRAVRSSLLFQQTLMDPDARATNNDERHAEERRDPLVVMITSAAPKDGKTTSSANLAAVFGEAGARVLVLNCDFRRPKIHEYFGVSDEPRRLHRTSVPGVMVVSNITTEADPNPAQVIAQQRHLVSVARERFDVVILDTAPLLSANDALELASEVDFVVLVARAGWSKYPAAQRAMEMLDRVDAPVVGSILVGLGEGDNYYYSYYGAGTKGHRPRSPDAVESNGHGDPADFLREAAASEEFSES